MAGRLRIGYIHCTDPLGSFTGCEIPPFTPDSGLLATLVLAGDNGRHKKGKKESANDAEEGGHL